MRSTSAIRRYPRSAIERPASATDAERLPIRFSDSATGRTSASRYSSISARSRSRNRLLAPCSAPRHRRRRGKPSDPFLRLRGRPNERLSLLVDLGKEPFEKPLDRPLLGLPHEGGTRFPREAIERAFQLFPVACRTGCEKLDGADEKEWRRLRAQIGRAS